VLKNGIHLIECDTDHLGPANTTTQNTDKMIGDDTTPSLTEQFGDPYDFNTLSPGPSEKGKEIEAPVNDKGKMNINARSTSRKSRASASFQGNAGSLTSEKGKETDGAEESLNGGSEDEVFVDRGDR
jgi:hypothetical protein